MRLGWDRARKAAFSVNHWQLGEQALQSRPEVGEGAAAVAELVLDQRAQLAEGLVILGDEEEGVVAEPACAPSFVDDAAAAGPFGFEARGHEAARK